MNIARENVKEFVPWRIWTERMEVMTTRIAGGLISPKRALLQVSLKGLLTIHNFGNALNPLC